MEGHVWPKGSHKLEDSLFPNSILVHQCLSQAVSTTFANEAEEEKAEARQLDAGRMWLVEALHGLMLKCCFIDKVTVEFAWLLHWDLLG